MNYYYIKHFASYRGKSNESLGKCLTDSDNKDTLRSIVCSAISVFRYIPLDKIEKLAFEFQVSPEWFYFAPVLFTASDFYEHWNDYLLRKKVPLMEQGQHCYEFVIGEKNHLPSWFDTYFDMKDKYLNKEITRSQWFNWAFLSLKPMPEDMEYEDNSGEVIRRFMRLRNIEVPSISDAVCEELYDNPNNKKKAQFLRTFKTSLNTDKMKKRMLIAFSDVSGILPDVCFSQFTLESPESLYNFFVVCDLTLAPVYYLGASSGEDEYKKRLVIYNPSFKAFEKSSSDNKEG